MSPTAVAAIVGVILIAALVQIRFPHGKRPWRRVDPRPGYLDTRPPRSIGRSMAELSSSLAWGSGTVEEWRRRCELSLERSRARRG